MIGAGLAGLVAALRLAEGGAHVTVVARGAGGLGLSPSTIDVLGYAPERVAAPRRAMEGFLAGAPGHPYARLAGTLDEALGWFRERTPRMAYAGDPERNMLLPTAVGVARPTALAPASIAAGALGPGTRLVVVGLRALKDFFPALLADNLARADVPGGPVPARHAQVSWSPRPDNHDVVPQVFARALDAPEHRRALGAALRGIAEGGETIALPAVLGLAAAGDAWADLQERAGAPIAEIPTIPPSVPGMRLEGELRDRLLRAGGRFALGAEAVGAEGGDGRLRAVLVRDAARTRPVPADAAVLATGGFASGGIELDSRGELRERALGLPVAGPPDGGRGLAPRHLDPQPLMAAGVRVDDGGRPVGEDGEPVWANLWAAGGIVAGALPWREKSGEGIAIAGAYRAAGAILEET